MGIEGLRRPKTYWHLGMGKLFGPAYQPSGSETHRTSQSYGGFMSCKVAEADAGVHSLAMAVAVSFIISL